MRLPATAAIIVAAMAGTLAVAGDASAGYATGKVTAVDPERGIVYVDRERFRVTDAYAGPRLESLKPGESVSVTFDREAPYNWASFIHRGNRAWHNQLDDFRSR